MDVLEFLLEVFFDGGGMQASHGTEMVGEGLLKCIETRGAGAVDIGQQHEADTGGDSTADGFSAVGVEGFVVEVAVGVEEHAFFSG